MDAPTVSVLMGIYNCADTLPKALDSLLFGTYQDFEIILCEDGSADNTFDVARDYVRRYPEKIKLVRNERNMGLNFTLNVCAKNARGRYFARQDGDDISLPERLQKQVAFLDGNPEYAIVSSIITYVDDKGNERRQSLKSEPVKRDFINKSPIPHAPCIIRREVFFEVGGYTVDPLFLRLEDYNLWVKMYAKGYKAYIMQESLYHAADGQAAFGRRTRDFRVRCVKTTIIHFKMLKMPIYYYPYVLRPLLYLIVPQFLYKIIHNRQLNG